MNTIYNVVWNSTTNTWVVASELATGRKKKSSTNKGAAAAVAAVVVATGMVSLTMPGAASAATAGVGGLQFCSPSGNDPYAGYTRAYGIYVTGGMEYGCTPGGSNASAAFSLNNAADTYGGGGFNMATARVTGYKDGTLELKGTNIKFIGDVTFDGKTSVPYFHANSTGADSMAQGGDSVAVGVAANAKGTSAIAIGSSAKTEGDWSIAAGNASSAKASGDVALGASASANGGGQWATAIGTQAQATATQSTAIGGSAKATHHYSVALGQASTTDRINSVSVGNASWQRQVTFVAKGTADTDAVNISQLKGVTRAIGGGAGVNADGSIKAPSYTIQGQAGIADVGTALGKLDAATSANTTAINNINNGGGGGGSNKYFHANSSLADSVATGSNSVAVGGAASAKGTSGIAIGSSASAEGDWTFAGGNAAVAKTAGDTALGASSLANGAGTYATALGVNAQATATKSTAVGANAKAAHHYSVALGQEATTDRINSVSVGNASWQRQVTFVAKGTADTDAVNVSQLKGVTTAIGGGAGVNTDGTIKAPDYVIGGSTVHTVGDAITNIDGRITNVFNGKAGLVQQSAAGANLTVGKDTDGAAVDFTAKAGTTRQLKGVTAGVADTDGVNVKQLNDKLASLPGGSPNAVVYDDASHTLVTLNKGGAATRITNVADGKVEAGSKDAVTGGQLFNAVDGITNAVGEISPKLKYVKFGPSSAQEAAATGSDSVAIGGNAFANGSSALAMGLNSRAAADKAFAAGAGAVANADSALALGAGARAQGANSVALGAGSSVAASENWVVSIGGLTGKRRITNMADGIADSDGATVGQVNKAIDTAMTSKSRLLQATPRATTSSVPVDQLIVAGPTTLGGQIEAKGQNALAIGLNTHATADNAVAVGQNVTAVTKESVGVGQNVVINGERSVVIGSNVSAIADDAAVIGTGAAAEAVGGVAIGKSAAVLSTGTNSVAIGRDTQALAASTVVLGQGSTDDNRANTVSVGSTLGTAVKRQVINVARGTADTDAVNVSQLKGLASAVGGGAAVAADGSVTKPTITVGGNDYATVADAIGAVEAIAGTGDALGVAYDDASKAKVTLNKGAGAVTIANVKAGVADDEAVNVKQLKGAGLVGEDGKAAIAVTYDSDAKDSVTLGSAGKPVKLKNVANATEDDEAINLGQLKSAGLVGGEGSVLDAVTYDVGSNKASVSFGGTNGTVLNNVADGRIEANSRQAVNGGQIAAIKDALEGKITNIDNRVTKIEQNGGGGGSPAYINANGSGDSPKPASAGDTAGVAMGYDSNASGAGASAIGDHATAQGKDSVAVGNNASTSVGGDNSVALGNGSIADRANTVSVGSEGHERTISNVARGNRDNDVATVGQVNETVRDLSASANAYTDKMVNDVWTNLSEELDHSSRQANRGIAAAAALINVTPYVPGHTTVNAGVAGYRGETALGVGVSRWSENGRVNLNAGVSAAQGDEAIFRVGVGYIF
ncbi:YadA-like family protein [Lysobacter sp. S4-A87]|uniref:beta strand repeat-containing protein n=1 Tax=Lysobacter sp. S4-A87 TaxID=2925843 RepID=UPI001F52C588|nr:YadA-like family protein [Lysobacter sp. S4-A87]UNK47909.1 YadA-like family protein [Lysobacter sp. S4-A87]